MKNKKQFLKFFAYTLIIFASGYLCALFTPTTANDIWRLFKKPTVSVVMSTYNRADALPHAIESILNQTYQDFEFIIIDDGSTDNTSQQIAFYAQKDPRIIHLKNAVNKGLIYSLNRGLDIARGKYIVRMDDDDKSLPYRLERQVWAMDLHPEITILGGGITGKKSNPAKPIGIPEINNPDEVELNTYFSSGLAHPTIIIRRDFLEKHHIRYNMAYTYAEDCGLYKDILAKGGRISSLKESVLIFGFITGLKKPESYSFIQSESFKKIQKEKFQQFTDIPYELLGAFNGDAARCKILKTIAPINKEKKILNQAILEKRINSICRSIEKPAFEIEVIHPFWQDTFGLDKNRKEFYRMSITSETGKIIKEDEQTATISWDNWGKETFTKITPTKWEFKNKE